MFGAEKKKRKKEEGRKDKEKNVWEKKSEGKLYEMCSSHCHIFNNIGNFTATNIAIIIYSYETRNEGKAHIQPCSIVSNVNLINNCFSIFNMFSNGKTVTVVNRNVPIVCNTFIHKSSLGKMDSPDNINSHLFLLNFIKVYCRIFSVNISYCNFMHIYYKSRIMDIQSRIE